jgi:hypothetical protein
LSVDEEFYLKTTALAQMETVSFCAGVRRKKFSVQLETAPENTTNYKAIFVELWLILRLRILNIQPRILK